MPRILQRVKRQPGEVAESDLWRTPYDLFRALDDEFGFALDCAADEDNRLCASWLGPGSIWPDALAANWRSAAEHPYNGWHLSYPHLWGFLNPPYSSTLIAQFVERAAEEATERFGVVALLPDTHDTRWYRHLRWASEIRRIPHRVPYLKADGTTKDGAMFPSCVAIFRPQPGVRNPHPRIVEWSWRQE